jgi:hypothetical protein
MGAGYVATWTAFVVTNIHFLPPVLVWLAPSVTGAVLIVGSIRRYSKPNRQSFQFRSPDGRICTVFASFLGNTITGVISATILPFICFTKKRVMAHPNIFLVNALREAAKNLRNGAQYAGGITAPATADTCCRWSHS